MKNRSFVALAALSLLAMLLVPATASAQAGQVGQLGGEVKTATGVTLSGAAVTLVSVERGFTRHTTSDAFGKFMFAVVPLGRYTVTVKLTNFETVTLTGNLVEAERTTALTVILKVAPIEAVTTVIGETPIVDVGNQTQETRVRVEEFAKLAIARNYQALIGAAAGVVGTGNVNAHGALSSNNIFMFDGVNTTDPTTGTFGANLNFEAIQEVVIRTSTVGVEYGRGTGAITDVITKSGTNRFEGSFKYLVTNDQWNAPNTVVSETDDSSLARTRFDHINPIYSGTIGGPIAKDNLWFFFAYEDARNTTPERQTNGQTSALNQSYQQTTSSPFWTGRVSAQVAQNHHVWAKYSSSPTDGFVNDYWGNSAELQALTSQNQTGTNLVFQYNGVLGTKWTATFMASNAPSRIDVVPFNTVGALEGGAPFLDLNDGRFYNGATFDGSVERPRRQASGALEYFTTIGRNSHAVKFGGDWQRMKSVSHFRFPVNRVYYVFDFDPVTRSYTPFVFEEYDDAPSTSTGDQIAFYARDRFQVGSRVSIEAGVRVERQTGTSDIGAGTVDAWSYSPRVSGSIALTDAGKSILVGSWGRFHDSILQGFSDAFASVPQQANYNSFTWNPGLGDYEFSFRNEQGANTFMPNLGVTPRVMDEMTAGFQHQVSQVLGFGVRAIDRRWSNFIDDVRSFNGDGSVSRVVQNVDSAERTYRGVEFTLDNRFSNNWSASGSYTYSQTRGNHFGDDFTALEDFSGAMCRQTVDPGLGDVDGVFPCSDVQSRLAGRPGFDRPHLAKFFSAYRYPMGPIDLTAGFVGLVSSKTTYSRTRTVSVLVPGTIDQQATTLVYNYDGLGSERVEGMFVTTDFALEAMYRAAGRAEIGVKFEAFNLLNNEDKVGVTNTAWCAGTGGACDGVRAVFGTGTNRGAFLAPRTYRVSFAIRY